MHQADVQGIGQRDGRLQSAQLVDLQQPDALSKAVEHEARGRILMGKRIFRPGQKHGYAGLMMRRIDGAVPDQHAGNIRNLVERAGRKRIQ